MISYKSFFDLSTNKFHHLNLPLLGRICGSSHGWLVILKQTFLRLELILLNPITGATLSLPSLKTYSDLVAKVFHHSDNNLHLIKVVLSSNPSLNDDFVAFAILNCSDFVFCKKGYNSWVLLNHASANNYRWIDAVYKDGSFFVTSINGIIAVCDIEGSRVFLHENTSISSYLINSCYTVLAGEDMLLVKQLNDTDSTVTGFKIFKMDLNMLEWEEVQTLGEYSLFIGKNSSLCFSAADFVGFRPNCIYFTTNLVRERHFSFTIYNLYNLSNHLIKPFSCYPIYLNFLLGYPIWVTPNPR
ncbi:hypothetical protein QL285_017372 [Trifolium repens]|nr:hypothetical protein QL285_017372 [Trifolium repens]